MQHIKTDIAVIAAGPAGLAAAITGAELGMDVTVFEKAASAGGTANMGMGPFGVESRIQKQYMIGLTKEEAFEEFMDYTHWKVDAHLVHDYFWKSGETIDWLEDMGVEFDMPQKYYPGSEATWHVVKPLGGGTPGPRSASAMIKVMHDRAEELGVDFYFNTPVKKILVEDGTVTGLEAENGDGEIVQAEAKAVIIATGGFGNNPDMIRAYTGYEYGENIFNFRIPGIDGDGLKMAWKAGAAKGHMEMEMTLGCKIPGDGTFMGMSLFRQARTLIVNKKGDRVMNEAIMENNAVAKNVADRQIDKSLYVIITDKIVRYFRKNGMDFASGVFRTDPTENFEEAVVSMEEQYPDTMFSGDSLEELAEKAGIPVERLEDTVDEYNESCDLNYDDLFCKPRKYLQPIEGKKYYALRMSLGAYGSLGGIVADHRCSVLDENRDPIPGLYAAGSDICDLYAGTYLYALPGNTMGFAVNSGRIAAESAVDDIEETE